MFRATRTRSTAVMLTMFATVAVGIGASQALHAATRTPDRTHVVQWYPVTNLADDRRLAGIAENVFVGRVDEVLRVREGTVPETEYRVTVLASIKGTLSESVVVNQEGGYLSDGSAVIMEGDRLLERGASYLFATRRHPDLGFHTLVPRYGDLRMDGRAEQATLVARFTRAVAEQIAFSPRG